MDWQGGKCYLKMGSCHCLFVSQEGRPWICIGPDWRFLLGLFTMLGVIGGLFVFKIAAVVGGAFQLVGIGIYGVTMVSYALAGLLDPGIDSAPNQLEPLVSDSFCSKCHSRRNASSIHCDACGVCIRLRDHHCPWVGKCIGGHNIIPFYLFLVGIVGMVFYILMCAALVQKPNRH